MRKKPQNKPMKQTEYFQLQNQLEFKQAANKNTKFIFFTFVPLLIFVESYLKLVCQNMAAVQLPKSIQKNKDIFLRCKF